MSTKLYFRSVAASRHLGNRNTNLAGTAVGWEAKHLDEGNPTVSTAVTATVNTVAGPTSGLEVESSTFSGSKLEWITYPLSADVTIAGTITLNLWGFEANMNDNVAINAVVDKIDGSTGTITQIAKSAFATEIALTTAAANNFTVTPTSTACKHGDRLRVRVFADDAGTMGSGGSMTFSYNNGTSGGTGDSWIQFTENLGFQEAPYIANNTCNASQVFGNAAATQQVAQVFTVPSDSSGMLRQIWTQTWKTGTTRADSLVVEIQTVSGGNPTGTVVGTGASNSWGIVPGTNGNWLQNLYSIQLTPGTTYAIVLRWTGSVDASNFTNANYGPTSLNWPTAMRVMSSGVWGAGSGVMTMRVYFDTAVFYLNDAGASTPVISGTDVKQASKTRGASTVNVTTNTVAGPTSGTQITSSAGGNVLEWYTNPLKAFTLGGTAIVNIWGSESVNTAEVSLKAEIAVVDTAGTTLVATWGVANNGAFTSSGSPGEIGTAGGGYSMFVSGDDLAISAGQRLRIRVFLDDTGVNNQVSGNTATLNYNGPNSNNTGDAYVQLPQVANEDGYYKSGYGKENG